MRRILVVSFSLFSALVLAQNTTGNGTDWPTVAPISKPSDNWVPRVTCVERKIKPYGSDYTGQYFNDWGKLQKNEIWNQTLELRQVVTCQNITTKTLVGISAAVAQVNNTDPNNTTDLSVYPLGSAGLVDASVNDVICSTMNLSPGEYIKTIGLSWDDYSVQRVIFYSDGGQIFGISAPGEDNNVKLINFAKTNQLIGFFGRANENQNITALSFLTYQESCRKYNPSERALAITGAVFATIGILLLILGCCCGVPICGCFYVRKRRPDLVQKIKVPHAIAKLAPGYSAQERGKILPDSSMAGDIEVTDNNIEDKSAIMTEDVAGKGGKK